MPSLLLLEELRKLRTATNHSNGTARLHLTGSIFVSNSDLTRPQLTSYEATADHEISSSSLQNFSRVRMSAVLYIFMPFSTLSACTLGYNAIEAWEYHIQYMTQVLEDAQ